MNFKSFALVFFTLLTIQTSSQSSIKSDSIKEIVLLVLDKVLEVTGSVLDKANDLIDTTEQNQEQITQDIINFVVAQGKALNVAFLAFLDSLKDGATEDGKAIVDCIEDERNKTEAAFEEVSTKIGYCAADEITVILAQFRTILSQLGGLQADLQKQADSLSSCSDDELTCLTAFVGDLSTTLQEIPAVIEEDIEEIIELIEAVIDHFSTCEIDATIFNRTQEIFNEAVICIFN